jgi:hypothetical protein
LLLTVMVFFLRTLFVRVLGARRLLPKKLSSSPQRV